MFLGLSNFVFIAVLTKCCHLSHMFLANVSEVKNVLRVVTGTFLSQVWFWQKWSKIIIFCGRFWPDIPKNLFFFVAVLAFLSNGSFSCRIVLANCCRNVFVFCFSGQFPTKFLHCHCCSGTQVVQMFSSLVLAIKISDFLCLAVPKISIFRVVLANVVKCLQFVKFFWPPFSPPKCSSCQVVILRV